MLSFRMAWVHRLTDIDPDTLTAHCEACGPVKVKRRQRGFRCRTAVREERERHNERHPPLARRCAKYGLTPAEYEAMYLAQGGCCAICQIPTDDLHIDHDHDTGKVRGLLCDLCNRGLGYFKDDPDLLREAARFVLAHL